jgi:hypothetical protein
MYTNSRTTTVLSYLRCEISLQKSVENLLHDYQHAEPFPHLVLDNLFPAETLNALLDELPPLSSERWVHDRRDQLIKSNLRSAVDLGDQGFQFASILHSAGFLYFLSEITGIKALLPDPYLTGAGYHVVPEGGKFDVHVDRNMDHFSGLQRRLAMLIYLNRDWKSEYGGQLELWDKNGSRCERVIEPVFNRTVIFEIGDCNFHAIRAVAPGRDLSRRSFAAYFHTVGNQLVVHNSIYAPKIFQDKGPLLGRLVRDTLPPFVLRTLKTLRDRRQP